MKDTRLRAVSFNIQHGGPEGRFRHIGLPWLVSRACRELQPDILALQEVDVGVLRSGFVDIVQSVAKATGLKALFAPTRRHLGGRYGNALFVNGDIMWHKTSTLHPDTRQVFGERLEPRNATLAGVAINGLGLSVAATHLGGQQRRGQLTAVARELNAFSEPRLILGDFNMLPETVEPILQENGGYQLGPARFTSPASAPVKQIDFIAVKGLEIVSTEAMRLTISDHCALVTELIMPR